MVVPAPRFDPVTPRHRLTIRSIEPDPRAAAIAQGAAQLGLPVDHPSDVAVADVIFVEADLTTDQLTTLQGFLVDPLLQRCSWLEPTQPGVEVTFLAGVTDSAAATVRQAAARLGEVVVAGHVAAFRRAFETVTDAGHAEVLARLTLAVGQGVLFQLLLDGDRPAADAAVAELTEMVRTRIKSGDER